MEYYRKRHVPPVLDKSGGAYKGAAVDEGIAVGSAASNPTYIYRGPAAWRLVRALQLARTILFWLLSSMLAIAASGSASANTYQVLPADIPMKEKRLALVIGNSSYKSVPSLRNTAADSTAVAASVRKVGFETFLAQNLDRRGMNEVIARFLQRVEAGSEVLVYYAGHGVEMQGSNYLLPIDIPALGPEQERLLRTEGVNLTELLQDIEARATRMALVILDACRDNPFRREGTRSLGATRGLGRVEPPRGSFVIYAAGVGEQALDSLGPSDQDPNGLFTRQFLRLLKEDGLELRAMVRKLRAGVREAALTHAGHSQIPSYYDQMLGEFYFLPPGASADIGKTECDRLVDAGAARDDIKKLDVEALLQACMSAVERFPNEPRLRHLLQVAQDQRAYRKAVDSKDRGMAEAYLVLFSNGRYVADVRQHLASLGPIGPTPSLSPPAIRLDPKEVARVLQIELARVGCDPGAADGAWGPASQQAMKNYNRSASANHDALSASMAALEEIRAKSSRVCPLTCRIGYKPEGATCTAIGCPSGQVANAAGVCVTPALIPRASTAGQNCITFNRQRYCD